MKNILKNKIKEVYSKLYSFKYKGFNQGLTLVEVLAAMAIFSILSVSILTLFTNSITTQAAILQNQQLLNDSGYVVEYMHKALRMAYRDDGTLPSSDYPGYVAGNCTGSANLNYNIVSSPNPDKIYFLGFDNALDKYVCMKFYLSSGKIMFQKSTNTALTAASADASTAVELTSSQVVVNILNFSKTGDTVGTGQPKVTIMLDMQSKSKRVNPIPRITIQTTASQRNLNVNP